MKQLAFVIAVLFFVGLTNLADAEEVKQTLLFGTYASIVELKIVEIEPYKNVLKLNGKVIHKDDGNMWLNFDACFESFGSEGRPVVLMSESLGGSGSGTYYRVLELKPKGPLISDKFGSGMVPVISADTLNGKLSLQFPKGLSKVGVGGIMKQGETWVYEKGKVKRMR